MSSFRQIIRRAQVPRQSCGLRPVSRAFSETRIYYSDPPPSNHPPSAKQAGRDSHVSADTQSSASSKDPDEQKSGDDHPAKQPDPQQPSDRSTGFGNVKEVKGGKEGLGARSDKQ